MARWTIALLLLASAQAHAGAYTFQCSNAGTSILIAGSAARVGSPDEIQSALSEKQVLYKSKSFPIANDTENAVLSIEVVGQEKTLSKKKQTDECGNVGEKRLFSAKVVVKNAQSKEKINEDVVLCEESFFPGHCS